MPKIDVDSRNELCPLCGSKTDLVLEFRFNKKLNLPTEPKIRSCPLDNFLFVANGSQSGYDEYYRSRANDSYHSEVSLGSIHSPIALLQRDRLVQNIGSFFQTSRKVLDFACGEARLLLELAKDYPTSDFFGYDPSPATKWAEENARSLNLYNLSLIDIAACSDKGPYDLIIVSHVLEHLLDFQLLGFLRMLLRKDGLIYVEVPNSLQYGDYERKEFLYYFDRLHVNHFTPQALVRLMSNSGFEHMAHFEYAFPYRDGGEYPALGILFNQSGRSIPVLSSSLADSAKKYIEMEKARAKRMASQFYSYPGVLIWGAGDNFFRSLGNDGPLSGLPNIVVLDSRPQKLTLGAKSYFTELPEEGIRRLDWPLVITISEGRESIRERVRAIDPARQIFFI